MQKTCFHHPGRCSIRGFQGLQRPLTYSYFKNNSKLFFLKHFKIWRDLIPIYWVWAQVRHWWLLWGDHAGKPDVTPDLGEHTKMKAMCILKVVFSSSANQSRSVQLRFPTYFLESVLIYLLLGLTLCSWLACKEQTLFASLIMWLKLVITIHTSGRSII